MTGDWQFLQIQKKGGCIAGDRVGDGNFEDFWERVTPSARRASMIKNFNFKQCDHWIYG